LVENAKQEEPMDTNQLAAVLFARI